MPRREPPFTVKEAAEALNQTEKAIRYLCKSGAFPNAIKIGKGGPTSPYRIPAADIDRYEKLQPRASGSTTEKAVPSLIGAASKFTNRKDLSRLISEERRAPR